MCVVLTPWECNNASEARALARRKCLYSVLIHSPHIAQNVRQLTIINCKTRSERPETTPQIGWIEDETLHLILGMLTRVETVGLRNIGGREYHSASLQHAIQSVLRLPCLVALSLIETRFANITAMAQALHFNDCCPNLKRLEVKDLRLGDGNLPIALGEGPNVGGSVRLEELYVDANTKTMDRITEWLLHPASGIIVSSSLHTLHVVDWHPTQCVNTFLRMVGSSVKHLEFGEHNSSYVRCLYLLTALHTAKRDVDWNVYGTWPQSEDTIFMQIDYTPNLETLKVRFNRKLDTDIPPRLWLNPFLRPSQSLVHLKSITIAVIIDECSAPLMSDAGWKELDGILMDENFPSLANVEIHVIKSLKDGVLSISSSKVLSRHWRLGCQGWKDEAF